MQAATTQESMSECTTVGSGVHVMFSTETRDSIDIACTERDGEGKPEGPIVVFTGMLMAMDGSFTCLTRSP